MKCMADREKVKKGLSTCREQDNPPGYIVVPCEGHCPYYKNGCARQLKEDALELLEEQDSEAKWIYGEDKTGVDGWHCSECGFFEPWFYEFTDDIDFIRFYGFCPNCGRKMTSYTGKSVRERR